MLHFETVNLDTVLIFLKGLSLNIELDIRDKVVRIVK